MDPADKLLQEVGAALGIIAVFAAFVRWVWPHITRRGSPTPMSDDEFAAKQEQASDAERGAFLHEADAAKVDVKRAAKMWDAVSGLTTRIAGG